MTVKELIEQLQAYDPETEVLLPTDTPNQFTSVDAMGETEVAWTWGSDGHKCWVAGLLNPARPRKAVWLE